MKDLVFSTGNTSKFETAQHTCAEYGITLSKQPLDIPEIQSETPEDIARDKSTKAYALIKQPVVITDDSWSFAGLNGFPGAYMRSMNEWFTAEDFLRLVLPLSDRTVTLTQCLVFTDGTNQKVFSRHTPGTLLRELRGTSSHPSELVISLRADGLSIAEAYALPTGLSEPMTATVWHDFATWFSKQ